jgi:predicted NACHT family NTPase
MKTLPILLLAVLLCGSALASSLDDARLNSAAVLSKKMPFELVDKAKGMGRTMSLSGVDFIKLIASQDRWSSAARQALVSDASAQRVVAQLRSWRKVVAQIDDPEAKTFIARTLDPALATLDVLAKNPAGRTQAHVDVLTRLATALEIKADSK